MMNVDTIAAITTPRGRGGVGVIRVSGPQVKSIAHTILKILPEPRKAYYGSFYDMDGEVLDQGIALLFESPNSFTGEDVLELHAHGSPIVLDALLNTILKYEVRIARPGEFSERAFLNDKIDLSQAEAIADLIDASSSQAAKLAIKSLQGEFSKRIDSLIKHIIDLRTFTEAEIDFSDEEIEFLNEQEKIDRLDEILENLNQINQSAKQGSILREGITVVIIGKPNVGKSSLLNCLSGQNSAIVTNEAGTTRDVIREQILIDDIPFYIFDTAGLQESDNIVEQEGISRTWQEIEKADHILFMLDDSIDLDTDILPYHLRSNLVIPESLQSKLIRDPSITIIKNKIDLTKKKAYIEERDHYSVIYLSAKTQEGVDLLKRHLKKVVGFEDQSEGIFMARRRHLDALERAKSFLVEIKQQITENYSRELIAENLRQAQLALSEITGEFTPDDLLDKIFSSFCVGK